MLGRYIAQEINHRIGVVHFEDSSFSPSSVHRAERPLACTKIVILLSSSSGCHRACPSMVFLLATCPTLTLNALYHTTLHHTNCSPERQDLYYTTLHHTNCSPERQDLYHTTLHHTNCNPERQDLYYTTLHHTNCSPERQDLYHTTLHHTNCSPERQDLYYTTLHHTNCNPERQDLYHTKLHHTNCSPERQDLYHTTLHHTNCSPERQDLYHTTLHHTNCSPERQDLYHTTLHHTNCNPERQDPCNISYFNLRHFEGSENCSVIPRLLVKIDTCIWELKISSLLLSRSRTGVGTYTFFNRKLTVKAIVKWTGAVARCSAFMMSASQVNVSNSPSLSMVYMWA